MGQRELGRVREIVSSLPEVTERVSHHAPCFFIRRRIALCRFHDHHRGDDRISLWCPLPVDVRDALLTSHPEKYFAPTPSAGGTFGNWIGVYLDDADVDWQQVAFLLRLAFREVAPTKLIDQLPVDDG